MSPLPKKHALTILSVSSEPAKKVSQKSRRFLRVEPANETIPDYESRVCIVKPGFVLNKKINVIKSFCGFPTTKAIREFTLFKEKDSGGLDLVPKQLLSYLKGKRNEKDGPKLTLSTLRRMFEKNIPIIGFEKQGVTNYFLDASFYKLHSEDKHAAQLLQKGYREKSDENGREHYVGFQGNQEIRIYFVNDMRRYVDVFCILSGIIPTQLI